MAPVTEQYGELQGACGDLSLVEAVSVAWMLRIIFFAAGSSVQLILAFFVICVFLSLLISAPGLESS